MTGVITPLAIIILQWIYTRTLRDNQRYESTKLKISNQIITINDKVVEHLPSLFRPTGDNRSLAISKLINAVLADISDLLKLDGLRGSVLVPNGKSDYLTYLGSYHINPDDLIEERFHITGNPDDIRGLPGWTFVTGNVEKATLTHSIDKSICLDNSHYAFHSRKPKVSYSSIISLPIKAPGSGSSCVGVLCFDSTNTNAFNSDDTQDVLAKFSLRLYSALLVYNYLESC